MTLVHPNHHEVPQGVRRWYRAGVMLLIAIASIYFARYTGTLSQQFALSARLTNAMFFACAALAIVALSLAVYESIRNMMSRPARPMGVLRCDSGVVLTELALVLPALIVMIGTLFQLVMIFHAALVIRYAAVTAARTAAVRFVRDGFTADERLEDGAEIRMAESAILVCATISPQAGIGSPINPEGDGGREPGMPSGDGETDPLSNVMERVLGQSDAPYGARTIGMRIRYSRAATTVTARHWVPVSLYEFTQMANLFPPREVEVTVQHQFYLALGGLTFLPGLTVEAPANVDGRAFPITQVIVTQSAGSRVASPGNFIGTLPRP